MKRPWNWCGRCRQAVDVPDGSHDGSEVRCIGCRRWFVVVEHGDGVRSFALEPRLERSNRARRGKRKGAKR